MASCFMKKMLLMTWIFPFTSILGFTILLRNQGSGFTKTFNGKMLREAQSLIRLQAAPVNDPGLARPQDIRSDDDGCVNWDPEVVRFERWAVDQGACFGALVHGDFPGPIRGLMATRDIEGWEPLVSLPLSAMLCVNMEEKTCPVLEDLVDPRYWESTPWYLRLALVLLVEKSKGSRSDHSPYIEALPGVGEFDTIIHWTDLELSVLDYPQLLRARAMQNKLYRRFFRQLKMNSNNVIFSELDYPTFEWALEIVLSRAYQLPPQSSSKMEPQVEVLDGSGKKETVKTDDNMHTGMYALLPIMDSLNHYSRFQTDMYWDEDGQLCIKTEQRYDKGDHVFVSYGPRSNDDLMQYYGFCEHDNRNDEYVALHPKLAECILGSSKDNEDIQKEEAVLPRMITFRKDGLSEASMGYLRKMVATPEEKEAAAGNYATHISLENELKSWAATIALMKLEQKRLQKYGVGIAPAIADELSADKAYMAEIFKAGKLRLLKENIARLEHFSRVSEKIGKVTTVWIAPEEDQLKTIFYEDPVVKFD